ncbi:MAG: hypothetical protein L3J43_08050 [Sulfurovum sp.]|nr:hypothetical protein [Sulfurovum sp.]
MGSVKFLEIAQDELDNVYEAYQYQTNNGQDFIQDIKVTLSHIVNYPNIYYQSSEHTHRAILQHFSYAIIYKIHKNDIVVMAIVNLRKKPTLWASKSVSEYATNRISILPDTMYTR